MAKDFIQEMSSAYVVTTQLMISDSDKPTDMRQTCGTIDDFVAFKEQTGMELRYPGLVTYEEDTKLFRGCFKDENGDFQWSTLNINTEQPNSEIEALKADMAEMKQKMESVYLEYENMFSLQFDGR